ncbi:hypothetical protein GE118_04180 [Mycoplasma sp. NEAQ87857]|uniref:Mbov_0396 family ICE element transmembrane protein n=1 Tax=Mycoplasma sp. NEAQ87857 TaxID=2683967 RepID=UPI001317F10E|nr:hypothetical protein [Mycoplasma sp. NEAQ87857]QGZ97974.1 hypothetical protein GE118_04180 [Mycoplasma sp. NEAQ87857]
MSFLTYILSGASFIIFELPGLVLFGVNFNKDTDIIGNISVNYTFIRFAIVSVLMMIIFFVASMIRFTFYRNKNNTSIDVVNPIKTALKWSIFSVLLIMSLVSVLAILGLFINNITQLILGENANLDVSSYVWSIIRPESVPEEQWINTSYFIPSSTFAHLNTGEGIKLIFLGALPSIVVFMILMSSLFGVVNKIFQLFFMFIISPLIASTSIFDSGARIKIWFQLFISKWLAIMSLGLSLKIWAIFINVAFNQAWANNDFNFIEKFLYSFIILVGSTMGFSSVSSIITTFIGDKVSAKEDMMELQGLMRSTSALSTGLKVGFAATTGGVGAIATGLASGLSKKALVGKFAGNKLAKGAKSFGNFARNKTNQLFNSDKFKSAKSRTENYAANYADKMNLSDSDASLLHKNLIADFNNGDQIQSLQRQLYVPKSNEVLSSDQLEHNQNINNQIDHLSNFYEDNGGKESFINDTIGFDNNKQFTPIKNLKARLTTSIQNSKLNKNGILDSKATKAKRRLDDRILTLNETHQSFKDKAKDHLNLKLNPYKNEEEFKQSNEEYLKSWKDYTSSDEYKDYKNLSNKDKK